MLFCCHLDPDVVCRGRDLICVPDSSLATTKNTGSLGMTGTNDRNGLYYFISIIFRIIVTLLVVMRQK